MIGVYFLQSENTGRYYIGSTLDYLRRIKEHHSGQVNTTRNMRPLKEVFFQEFADIVEARRIEYKLKKMKSRAIIEMIIRDGHIKLGQ